MTKEPTLDDLSKRLGDGTQILPSPEGYSRPCRCGAALTWYRGSHEQNAADCPCGMSYYATDETRVKIEGFYHG